MTRFLSPRSARQPFAVALLLAAALLLGWAALATRALADGDPASDVLLGENVFYPYSPAVSGPLQRTLNAESAALAKAGLGLKVALIASPVDLGVIPDLFGKPQRYASFLDQEISYQKKQPLLVVMAAGYGAQGVSPRTQGALRTVPVPSGKASDDLARAAIVAVARVAKAEGRPIRGVSGMPGSAGSGSGSGSGPLLVVLVLLAALTAGALMITTARRNRRPAGR